MCSRYSRTKGEVKVGKAKIAVKGRPQAIIRPTGRASVIRKGLGGLEVGRQDLLRSAPDEYLIKKTKANQTTNGCFDIMGSVSIV